MGEASQKEILKNEYPRDHWMAVGYGITLSPLHIITFYNAIANNGKMVYEGKVLNPQIATDSTIQSIQKTFKKHSKNIRKTFEKTVQHNAICSTEKFLKPSFAGKTGSAFFINARPKERYSHLSEVVSICGYFPVENPQYTCLVMIYDPNFKLTSRKQVDIPIFKLITEKIVKQK